MNSQWIAPSSWSNQGLITDDSHQNSSGSPVPTATPEPLKRSATIQVAASESPRKRKISLRPNRFRPRTAPIEPPIEPMDSRPSSSLSSSSSRGVRFSPETITTCKSPTYLVPIIFPTTNPVNVYKITLPQTPDLELASKMEVISENGSRVTFGSLFERRKTIVIFIRHFLCPLDQDYLASLHATVSGDVLERNKTDLVIIGHGSSGILKSYRKIFKSSFRFYTDPSLHVYHALGMTMRTTDSGPETECGRYVKHKTLSGMGMVLKNAVKNRTPVWQNGGDVEQLGGEFVLGPGLRCSYAHRMHTTRSHSSALTLLDEAGLVVREKIPLRRTCVSSLNEETFMAERIELLSKMRQKKADRRSGLFPDL